MCMSAPSRWSSARSIAASHLRNGHRQRATESNGHLQSQRWRDARSTSGQLGAMDATSRRHCRRCPDQVDSLAKQPDLRAEQDSLFRPGAGRLFFGGQRTNQVDDATVALNDHSAGSEIRGQQRQLRRAREEQDDRADHQHAGAGRPRRRRTETIRRSIRCHGSRRHREHFRLDQRRQAQYQRRQHRRRKSASRRTPAGVLAALGINTFSPAETPATLPSSSDDRQSTLAACGRAEWREGRQSDRTGDRWSGIKCARGR